MQPKKTLELNATHPVVTRVTNQIQADENDKTAKEMLSMLWDTALLSSGFSLSKASAFSANC
jgi:molecular chaperone HtpG